MRKQLSLLAVLLASLAVYVLVRPPLGGGAARPDPAPSAAGSEELESAERAPADEAGALSSRAAPGSSAGDQAPQLARVVLRARLGSPPAARYPGQKWSWLVELDGGPRGSLRGVTAPVGEDVEWDISKHFDDAEPMPTRLRVRVLDLWFEFETRQWVNLESCLQLDISDVPARRRVESEVVLAAVLDPLRSNVVRGVLMCAGLPLEGSVTWRHARPHGAAWVGEAVDELQVRCGAAFALPARSGGAVEWLASADGFLPRTGRLETPTVGDYDLGDITLSRGVRLAGRVSPAPQGVLVRAVCLAPPAELAAGIAEWDEVLRRGDDASVTDVHVPLDADGAFEFPGLFATDYRLELVGVPGLGNVELEPAPVRAPIAGLELSAPLVAVELSLGSSSTRPVRRVELRVPGEDGRDVSRRGVFLDERGCARVWVRAGQRCEFTCGDRVVPVLVHEIGSTVTVQL